MNSKAVLVVALAVLAGCRSDGGFDRKDNEQSFEFLKTSVVKRTKDDAANTWNTITTAPAAIVSSSKDSWESLIETYHLYLEAHAVR